MNAAAHQLTAGAFAGFLLAKKEQKAGQSTLEPVIGGFAAAILTKLPDLLEPATSPNHRQFFHSIVFASLLGLALHKLREWQPDDPAHKFWRKAGMLAISAYLVHLALDFTTAKSLPFIGKL